MPAANTGSRNGDVPPEVRDAAMRAEPDRYIAATLAPPTARPALAALAAFAAEVARIPATVSEELLGEIRLQWWRDALAEGREGRLSGHPVADSLIEAVSRHRLPTELLEAVLDARERDLSGAMLEDDQELAAYLQATEGNLFLLAMCSLGAAREEAAELAGLAGQAYGIARGLCHLPMLLHNGGVILPAKRLEAAGIDPSQLTSRPPTVEMEHAVRRVANAMAEDGMSALARARALARRLETRLRPALLPLVMVEPYFRAQSKHRILAEPVEISPIGRVIRIGLAHLTGRL
jgi:phytoene synthase